MTPANCKVGQWVWYTPSRGVAFLGRVASEPRGLGESWVVALSNMPKAYGVWRGTPERDSVPAAALSCLTPALDQVPR